MISYPSLVRRATPEDIDSLLLLVPQSLSETSLLPVSLVKIESIIERCVNQEGGSVAGVIDGEDGLIDASVGLTFCESETSDVPYIRVVWFGLHPGVRRQPTNPDDPKAHYGRTLFQFAKWCHENLELVAGHPILIQYDISTKTMLSAKMRLLQRNLTQTGAIFSLGAVGDFSPQKIEAEASA